MRIAPLPWRGQSRARSFAIRSPNDESVSEVRLRSVVAFASASGSSLVLPRFCASLQPQAEMCGDSREDALATLMVLDGAQVRSGYRARTSR